MPIFVEDFSQFFLTFIIVARYHYLSNEPRISSVLDLRRTIIYISVFTDLPLWQDFGYVQTTSTELLKSYIFNEPIVVDAARLPSLGPASIFMVLIFMIKHIVVACTVLIPT